MTKNQQEKSSRKRKQPDKPTQRTHTNSSTDDVVKKVKMRLSFGIYFVLGLMLCIQSGNFSAVFCFDTNLFRSYFQLPLLVLWTIIFLANIFSIWSCERVLFFGTTLFFSVWCCFLDNLQKLCFFSLLAKKRIAWENPRYCSVNVKRNSTAAVFHIYQLNCCE